MILFHIIRVFLLAVIAFLVTMAWTPLLTNFLYKHNFGKKIRSSKAAPIFSRLHQKKSGTPTMGGLLIWVTTAGLALFFFFLAKIDQQPILALFNFLSRQETLLPLGALVACGLVGVIDDLFNIKKIGPQGGGLRMWHRLVLYTIIAGIGAWWFYSKLDWDLIRIPFLGSYNIGFYYILCFVFVLVATAFSVNETDGLDGLAGGTLLTSFAAYGAIAFLQGRFDLAAFCGVIGGALVAFLWFNIYPARFFMGDTGAMSLGVTLGIIAMLTNQFVLLPVIGLIFVIESASVIIQTVSKKIRRKKIFLSTPIHHHFEAKGWPEPKIVMRFWLISGLTSMLGIIIFLVEQIVS